MPDRTPTPRRADAQRNRDRLLEAAATAFAEGRAPALEAVARSAGVGIGTLYRHFPTREALVEAVYAAELDRLCDSPGTLLADHAPDVALRTWMGRYSEFVATKNGMADALQSLVVGGAITRSATAPRLEAAVQEFLDAGARDGVLRADLTAEDVTAALAGMVVVTGDPGRRAQAGRLLDLLLDGLRPPR
jgi:AcrR family transcriptional regulator